MSDRVNVSENWVQIEDATLARGFTQIPNAVMRAKTLSMSAKYLYGLLLSYAWQNSQTHPGVRRLCEDAGVSKDTLTKYLKELKTSGLVEVKRRGLGKTNLYIFKSLSGFLDGERGSVLESDTGSHQDGERGSVLDGDGGSDKEYTEYEYAVEEDAVKDTPSGEPNESAPTSRVESKTSEKHVVNLSTSDVQPPDDKVEAWEYAQMMRESLKDSDVPLTRSRERRYVREFRMAMERGVEPEECDEAMDRIVGEWGRVQLSVDMALRDVRNGRQTNGRRAGAGSEDENAGGRRVTVSATPQEVVEYVFCHTKTPGILNNEANIRRALAKHDFTSGDAPPFPVAKMMGGTDNERWAVQDALESLCRRAVREVGLRGGGIRGDREEHLRAV